MNYFQNMRNFVKNKIIEYYIMETPKVSNKEKISNYITNIRNYVSLSEAEVKDISTMSVVDRLQIISEFNKAIEWVSYDIK